jgi:hypothetical protein
MTCQGLDLAYGVGLWTLSGCPSAHNFFSPSLKFMARSCSLLKETSISLAQEEKYNMPDCTTCGKSFPFLETEICNGCSAMDQCTSPGEREKLNKV